MDAVVVGFSADGQVEYEREGWSRPTLQETRAIIHAARETVGALEDLVMALERARPAPGHGSG
jgi:hypothetical protein